MKRTLEMFVVEGIQHHDSAAPEDPERSRLHCRPAAHALHGTLSAEAAFLVARRKRVDPRFARSSKVQVQPVQNDAGQTAAFVAEFLISVFELGTQLELSELPPSLRHCRRGRLRARGPSRRGRRSGVPRRRCAPAAVARQGTCRRRVSRARHAHRRTTPRAANAELIVNDRADLAMLAGAAGVHVGQDDLTPTEVARAPGPRSRRRFVDAHDRADRPRARRADHAIWRSGRSSRR